MYFIHKYASPLLKPYVLYLQIHYPTCILFINTSPLNRYPSTPQPPPKSPKIRTTFTPDRKLFTPMFFFFSELFGRSGAREGGRGQVRPLLTWRFTLASYQILATRPTRSMDTRGRRKFTWWAGGQIRTYARTRSLNHALLFSLSWTNNINFHHKREHTHISQKFLFRNFGSLRAQKTRSTWRLSKEMAKQPLYENRPTYCMVMPDRPTQSLT